MAKILTLDLGTTFFKLSLFDETGKLVALQRVAPPIVHPQPKWWEVDARSFQETVRSGLAELRQHAPGGFSDVAAVSFATQANSIVLLDEQDWPVTPLILWADERAADYADEMAELGKDPEFQRRVGMGKPTVLAMAAKIWWIQRNQPEIWARSKGLLHISDYLTYWLTGQRVCAGGVAGITGIADVHALEWWPAMCEKFGLTESHLPRIARAGTDLGPIRPEAAKLLGLPETCRFVVGCLDQYTGAIGAGNIAPGYVSETTGTVLAVVRYTRQYATDVSSEVYQGPAPTAGEYFQMTFGSTSANLLEDYRNRQPDKPDYDQLTAEAAKVPPGAEGLRALPRAADAPTLDRGFEGQTSRHTRGHEVRAILEAVAWALDGHVRALCGSQLPAMVRSTGGAARSDLWLQIKADVLGVPFVATTCPEPTSLGAAMLAGRALGWGDLAALSQKWIGTRESKQPNAAAHRAYQAMRR